MAIRKTPAVFYLLLSFFLPFLIMAAAFALNGVYPFGGRQILVVDFWQQYYPFFSDYWHKLREGSSLLWSWSFGAGLNYLALIAYYLASPLNFLIALFPHSLLREAVTLILLVKIGLAGLFFAMYLRYAFGRGAGCEPSSGRGETRPAALSLPMFSLFYALCAFTLGYYWNIMWFDTFALLPLVMLGLHALVREGRFRLYIVALALSVLINYYIGLFVCIYTALMFLVLCIIEKVGLLQLWRKTLFIIACTALALGITAMLTVPAFFSLQKTYSAVNSFPAVLMQYENYFDILGNFIAFTPPTTVEGLPNLYCGMLSVMLLGVFLRSQKVPWRSKLLYLGLTAFLIVSCNVNALNYIWHGFHLTNMLPYRFSFLISFTIAVMAYRAYMLTVDDVRGRDLLAMAASAAVFLVFAALGRQETSYVLWSSVLCLIYLIIFSAKIRYGAYRRFLGVILLLTVIAEFGISAYLAVGTVRTTDRGIYPDKYDEVQGVLALRKPADGGFYRTDTVNWYSINDPALYGYGTHGYGGGLSAFSSTVNRDTTAFMLGLGIYAGLAGNRYVYSQSTPVVSAFMNLRYLVSRDGDIPDGSVYWERAGSRGSAVLLENKYYLPFGFMVGEELLGYASAENDPIASQNDLFSRATGLEGDLFSKTGAMYAEHRMPASGALYVYVNTAKSDSVSVLPDGHKLRTRRTPYPVLFCAGTFSEGDIVSVTAGSYPESGDIIYGAVIDEELFERGYEILADETLELTEFSDTYIKGAVMARQDGLLYMSLPYEKGWRAFVDGQEREMLTVGGSMAAVRLERGRHTVELRYLCDGLIPGAAVSAVSLLAFAAAVLLGRSPRNRTQHTRSSRKRKLERGRSVAVKI